MTSVPESEEWRAIDGYPLYEVSNLGRVRSWNRKGRGSERRQSEPRIMAPQDDTRGYLHITLSGGGQRRRYVHQLVLEAFVGPRGEHRDGRHIDGCRTNNVPSTLEWCSHAKNMDDQFAHGTRALGAKHGMAKLTDEQAREIYAANGETYKAIGARYGVSASVVCNIKKRRKWLHLWSDLVPPSVRRSA
jgi:hypothetical protein